MRSHSMYERVTVWVGKDWDGFTFRLRPKTRVMLRGRFPDADMLPQISISFDEKKGFEAIHGPVYKYIVEMLCGVSYSEIAGIGGARFVDAETERLIYELKEENQSL
jgi:hypothetical protein